MGIAKHLISPAKTGPHQESQICEESRSPSPRPADSSLSLGVPPKSGPKFGDLDATQLLGHECHNTSICHDMSIYLILFACLSLRKVSSLCGQTYCSPELFILHSRLRSEPALQPSISRCFAQTRHRAAGRQKSWGVKTKTVDDAINHKVWWLYDRICSLNPSQISQILEYCYKAEFAAAFFGSKFSDSDFKNPGTFERSWDEGAQVALESQWTWAEFMLGKPKRKCI